MDKDPKHNSTVDQLLRLQPKVPHQRRTLVTEGYQRNPPCQVEKNIVFKNTTIQSDTPFVNVLTFTRDHVTCHHVTLQTKGKLPQVELGQQTC